MRTVSLSLPDSLHTQIKQLANRDGVSINQMIASAAAEKVAALLTEEYLQTRADRASQADSAPCCRRRLLRSGLASTTRRSCAHRHH